MLPEQYAKFSLAKGQAFETDRCRKMRYSSREVAVPTYNSENIIGKGHYGTVYSATWLNDRKVVVKEVNLKKAKDNNSCLPYREEKTLESITQLKSENIVEYLGSYVSGNSISFIMAFAGLQLDKFLEPLTGVLDEEHINNIIYQTLSALTELQKLKIAHGDFYLCNMCYEGSSDKIKLIDFGFSVIGGDDYERERTKDVSNLGKELLTLQLKMKGVEDEDELYQKKLEFRLDDPEDIISSDSYWCKRLSLNQKQFIIKCIFESEKPDAVLQLKNSFSSRLPLAALSV